MGFGQEFGFDFSQARNMGKASLHLHMHCLPFCIPCMGLIALLKDILFQEHPCCLSCNVPAVTDRKHLDANQVTGPHLLLEVKVLVSHLDLTPSSSL